MMLGFIDPEKVTGSGDYTVTSLDSSRGYKCCIIPTEKDNEFFIVENRQYEGFDAGMENIYYNYKYFNSYNKTGGIVLWHEPADIRTTVNQCIEVLKSSIIGRDLEITTSVSMSEHPYVLTDALRIRQILINIISNAVKFTPDGGRIIFKAEGHPDPEEKILNCRFEIADTGIGMDDEFQKNIFQTFVQADSGNARTNYPGSGLGMSIVKQYVDMLYSHSLNICV